MAKMIQMAEAAPNKVDILRLSYNVRRNLKREEEEESTADKYG